MNRSDMIAANAAEFEHLPQSDVDLAVHCILEHMAEALVAGERIGICG